LGLPAISCGTSCPFHAVCFDLLTSSVLSLAEIQQMVDEMMTQNKPFVFVQHVVKNADRLIDYFSGLVLPNPEISPFTN